MKLLVSLLGVFALTLGAHLPKTRLAFGESLQQRIYNGTHAKSGQFKFAVYLEITISNSETIMCGGSIIDNSWILTAAHCLYDARSVNIYYGSIHRAQGKKIVKVDERHFIIHAEYDNDSLHNDIALIKTPHINFTDSIDKVELVSSDLSAEKQWCYAIGWGCTSDEGEASEVLQFAPLKVVNDHICAKAIGREATDVICVSTSEGNSIGSGDSGGPLVIKSHNIQIGVNSFTLNQTSDRLPAAFARVSNFLNWIHDHTGIAIQ